MKDVINSVTPATRDFEPIAQLLNQVAVNKLCKTKLRLATCDRHELIRRFQLSFEDGRRIATYVLADELISRGIPPCFWHLGAYATGESIERRYDLMIFDLRWLRYWHLDHAKRIRYGRYRDLLLSTEAGFHRAAEFAFYGGRRPAWKIVGSLSLNERQQWDCVWLRSAPIKKRQLAIQANQQATIDAIKANLRKVRLTSDFTSKDAEIALQRRLALWVCGQMEGNKPTATAVRYQQMTGLAITRQTVGKQLMKVYDVLESEMTHGKKKEIDKGVGVPFSRT